MQICCSPLSSGTFFSDSVSGVSTSANSQSDEQSNAPTESLTRLVYLEQRDNDFWTNSFLQKFDHEGSVVLDDFSSDSIREESGDKSLCDHEKFGTESFLESCGIKTRRELENRLPVAPPPYTRRVNPFSGYDNCGSGTLKTFFAVSNLGALGSLIGSFSVASDALTAAYELHNALGECAKLKHEKDASRDDNALFAVIYKEIVSIRKSVPPGEIMSVDAQNRLRILKAINRKLAGQALTYDKAVSNELSAKLMLLEKSFRGVRDFIFGPSGTGLAAAKVADMIQVGTVAKIADFASKTGTALGTGLAIGGAVIGACTGALHLLQSIPEMRRWSRRVDEQARVCTALAGIDRDTIGGIIDRTRATAEAGAEVVNETENILVRVAERCHTENKKAHGIAKAEFAKSIVRCVFGLGSIVLGIVGFFFPPVALAALLFGAVYALYVGIHILVVRKLTAKQTEALAAEEEQMTANSQKTEPEDLTDNSAWLVSKVCDYLQGRARDGNGKFQSGAVKRLLVKLGMDKTVVKAMQAMAEAIEDIPDADEKAKAVKSLRQDLRYYFFSGGVGRKNPENPAHAS